MFLISPKSHVILWLLANRQKLRQKNHRGAEG